MQEIVSNEINKDDGLIADKARKKQIKELKNTIAEL